MLLVLNCENLGGGCACVGVVGGVVRIDLRVAVMRRMSALSLSFVLALLGGVLALR